MEIIKFGKKGCNPCVMVENFLNSASVPFTSIDVEENPAEAAANEVFFSVPVTILKDGDKEIQRVTGFNPGVLENFVEQVKTVK